MARAAGAVEAPTVPRGKSHRRAHGARRGGVPLSARMLGGDSAAALRVARAGAVGVYGALAARARGQRLYHLPHPRGGADDVRLGHPADRGHPRGRDADELGARARAEIRGRGARHRRGALARARGAERAARRVPRPGRRQARAPRAGRGSLPPDGGRGRGARGGVQRAARGRDLLPRGAHEGFLSARVHGRRGGVGNGDDGDAGVLRARAGLSHGRGARGGDGGVLPAARPARRVRRRALARF